MPVEAILAILRSSLPVLKKLIPGLIIAGLMIGLYFYGINKLHAYRDEAYKEGYNASTIVYTAKLNALSSQYNADRLATQEAYDKAAKEAYSNYQAKVEATQSILNQVSNDYQKKQQTATVFSNEWKESLNHVTLTGCNGSSSTRDYFDYTFVGLYNLAFSGKLSLSNASSADSGFSDSEILSAAFPNGAPSGLAVTKCSTVNRETLLDNIEANASIANANKEQLIALQSFIRGLCKAGYCDLK